MQFAYPSDNQPLHNPYPQEVTDHTDHDSQPETVIDPDQLGFDLQPDRFGLRDWIDGLRHKARRREVELELIPFWRSFSSTFAVITSVSLSLFLLVSGLALFSRLPPRIPFYYNSVEARWEQADKIVILLLPVIVGVIDALLLRFIYDIFAYDKRLSNMMSWLLTLVNLLIIIATGQIFSLIL